MVDRLCTAITVPVAHQRISDMPDRMHTTLGFVIVNRPFELSPGFPQRRRIVPEFMSTAYCLPMNRGDFDLEQCSDADLLRAHVNGNRWAFTLLVRRHHDRMAAVAYRTMSDPQEVPDALQDAWAKAHEMAAQLRADSQVSSWLHRIVINSCLDRMRRSRVRAAKLVAEIDTQLPNPTDRARDVDLAIALNRALRLLPEEQRRAILLVDVEGYTVAETADILGVATGTIKSRCARGRLKLSVILRSLRTPV